MHEGSCQRFVGTNVGYCTPQLSPGRDMKAPRRACDCPLARSTLMLAFFDMVPIPLMNAPFISPLALSTLIVLASSLQNTHAKHTESLGLASRTRMTYQRWYRRGSRTKGARARRASTRRRPRTCPRTRPPEPLRFLRCCLHFLLLPLRRSLGFVALGSSRAAEADEILKFGSSEVSGYYIPGKLEYS